MSPVMRIRLQGISMAASLKSSHEMSYEGVLRNQAKFIVQPCFAYLFVPQLLGTVTEVCFPERSQLSVHFDEVW